MDSYWLSVSWAARGCLPDSRLLSSSGLPHPEQWLLRSEINGFNWYGAILVVTGEPIWEFREIQDFVFDPDHQSGGEQTGSNLDFQATRIKLRYTIRIFMRPVGHGIM